VHPVSVDSTTTTRNKQVVAFDDAQADAASSIVGIAQIPLTPLSQGAAVSGSFPLHHPVSGAAAGSVALRVEWAQPLAQVPVGGGGAAQQAAPVLTPRTQPTEGPAAAAAVSLLPTAVPTTAPLQPPAYLQQEQLDEAEWEAHQQLRHQQHQPGSGSAIPQLPPAYTVSLKPPPEVHASAAAGLGHDTAAVPLLHTLPPPPPADVHQQPSAEPDDKGWMQPAAVSDSIAQQQQEPQQEQEGLSQQEQLLQDAEELLQLEPMPPMPPSHSPVTHAPDEQLQLHADELHNEEEQLALEEEGEEEELQLAADAAELFDAGGPAEEAQGGQPGGEGEAAAAWVMTRVPAEGSPSSWQYSADRVVYFRVDGLELAGDTLVDDSVGRTLVVAHSFLEAWTDAAAQCTEGVTKRWVWGVRALWMGAGERVLSRFCKLQQSSSSWFTPLARSCNHHQQAWSPAV